MRLKKLHIKFVLIKLAYETNHQRFDQNTLAFIRVILKNAHRNVLIVMLVILTTHMHTPMDIML